jgi:hypothetical protein
MTAGPHNFTTKSKSGCDSTVTLKLTILRGDTTYVIDTVSTDELPYEYLDLYYDENTEVGTYRNTFKVSEGDCESVIVHTLTVGTPTESGWTSPEANKRDAIFAPNPINVGETVKVHIDLTEAERKNLTVQVFNEGGALLQRFVSENEPIEIDGFDTSGIYIVRITDGLGHVYTGKIIVR